LCLAEYRESVTRCAQCDAALVSSLGSDAIRRKPPRLLWQGRDLSEFDWVVEWLREAQIPAHSRRALGGLVGAILRSPSSIHVLAGDVDRALQQIKRHSQDAQPEALQTCYQCSSQCSACLAICPTCSAILIVEPAPDEAISAPPTNVRKYCPSCDAEYASAHDSCSVCGVALVPEEFRGVPLTESEQSDRLEMIWRGGDPAALSRVVALLREAGIRHHVQSSSDHLVFEIAMPRPKYNIRILQSDAERAKQLLAEVHETPFFVDVRPRFPPESESPLIAPAHRWNPAAANAEVWAGDDAGVARLLGACLTENRIGFRRQGIEPGKQTLFVMPPDAPPAQ